MNNEGRLYARAPHAEGVKVIDLIPHDFNHILLAMVDIRT